MTLFLDTSNSVSNKISRTNGDIQMTACQGNSLPRNLREFLDPLHP